MVGQKEMFLEIWDERKHVCQVCFSKLGNEPNAWFFAHVISKGNYPAFKLRKKNIALICQECHYTLDHQTHVAKRIANFKWLINLGERLKRQYYWYQNNKLIVDYRLERQKHQ
jgi:hypothetical protein